MCYNSQQFIFTKQDLLDLEVTFHETKSVTFHPAPPSFLIILVFVLLLTFVILDREVLSLH